MNLKKLILAASLISNISTYSQEKLNQITDHTIYKEYGIESKKLMECLKDSFEITINNQKEKFSTKKLIDYLIHANIATSINRGTYNKLAEKFEKDNTNLIDIDFFNTGKKIKAKYSNNLEKLIGVLDGTTNYFYEIEKTNFGEKIISYNKKDKGVPDQKTKNLIYSLADLTYPKLIWLYRNFNSHKVDITETKLLYKKVSKIIDWMVLQKYKTKSF